MSTALLASATVETATKTAAKAPARKHDPVQVEKDRTALGNISKEVKRQLDPSQVLLLATPVRPTSNDQLCGLVVKAIERVRTIRSDAAKRAADERRNAVAARAKVRAEKVQAENQALIERSKAVFAGLEERGILGLLTDQDAKVMGSNFTASEKDIVVRTRFHNAVFNAETLLKRHKDARKG